MEVLEDVKSCVEAEMLLEVEEGGDLHLLYQIFLAEPQQTHGCLDWVDPGARDYQDSAQIQQDLHCPHVGVLNLDNFCSLLTESGGEHCSEHRRHWGQATLLDKYRLPVWFGADDEFQYVRIFTARKKNKIIYSTENYSENLPQAFHNLLLALARRTWSV